MTVRLVLPVPSFYHNGRFTGGLASMLPSNIIQAFFFQQCVQKQVFVRPSDSDSIFEGMFHRWGSYLQFA